MDRTAAVLAAHRALNLTPDFLACMTPGEREALVAVAAADTRPLRGRFAFAPPLRKDAYRLEELGEPDGDPVHARDLAARVFSGTQRPGAPGRDAFCAWCVFQAPRNRLKVYATADDLGRTLAAIGEPLASARLVEHPARPGAWTCDDLARKQGAINALWRGATAVASGAAADSAVASSALDEPQRAALATILRRPASLLCGMGGVGKSVVVGRAASAAAAAGCAVVCLAPTHKAKLNMSEQLLDGDGDVLVATVQSYALQLRRGQRLGPTLFVLDEASMLDVETFGDFAAAVADKCTAWQLCLVGDEMQLPPIGRGECFRTAVRQAEKRDGVCRLERCYRAAFAEMFEFHRAVRGGALPAGDGVVARVRVVDSDAELLRELRAVVAADGATTTYIAWKNEHVDRVNAWVQAAETGPPADGLAFNAGDRVVYVGTNRPKDRLTNALCGSVVRPMRTTAVVAWDNGETQTASVRDVRLAYCLTVHKAQGSGFRSVCVACLCGHAALTCLDRRWLYTAVSRARERVLVLCTPEAHELAARPVPAPPLTSLAFPAA